MRLSQALDRKESAAHVLIVLNAQGDSTATWDPSVASDQLGPEATATVVDLERQFGELRAQGHTAYAVQPGESGGKVLNAFDKEAEKIVMHPQIRGG